MLNIKRAETYDLARAVAERTGLSFTDAVTLALREKLVQLDEIRRKNDSPRVAVIRGLQQRVKDAWGEPLPTLKELDDELYDEFGLPK